MIRQTKHFTRRYEKVCQESNSKLHFQFCSVCWLNPEPSLLLQFFMPSKNEQYRLQTAPTFGCHILKPYWWWNYKTNTCKCNISQHKCSQKRFFYIGAYAKNYIRSYVKNYVHLNSVIQRDIYFLQNASLILFLISVLTFRWHKKFLKFRYFSNHSFTIFVRFVYISDDG